jgi:protein-disulfide isomerase
MSLGNPAAKVTMVEYASVACPHCALFNNTVFPAFKAQFIDTGKVHYVFREMLVGGDAEQSMAAAGFLMARCAGRDKYFSIVDAIFHQQEAIYQTGDIRGGLLKIAESAGMTEPQFTACISDDKAIKALNDRVDTYSKRDGINATPTFVINGKKLEGEHSLASLAAAVNAAQAAAH